MTSDLLGAAGEVGIVTNGLDTVRADRWARAKALSLAKAVATVSPLSQPRPQSSICTANPIMTQQKLQYHIYVSIQTLYSVLCLSTFGSDYSIKYFWV